MLASFQKQDFKHLTFPVKMYVDYVRVYQRSGVKEGVGCSPSSHPTADYIKEYVLFLIHNDNTSYPNLTHVFL